MSVMLGVQILLSGGVLVAAGSITFLVHERVATIMCTTGVSLLVTGALIAIWA